MDIRTAVNADVGIEGIEMELIKSVDGSAKLEQVLINGDLKNLSETERMQYYNAVCQSVGLNPLTQPFEYITLNGKLKLYAKKDATDQLRTIHGVSVTFPGKELLDGIYVVTAHASKPDGRVDESIGAVSLDNLKGEAKANALMKAETKAKRRVTLSICGLGMLDETEVDSIPSAAPSPAAPANGHWTDGKQQMNKEEREQAKGEAQAIAQRKVQEIRAEQPKPIVERSPALQQALDRIKDKESGISVLNDWIFEMGDSVGPEAVLNFSNFYKSRLGVGSSAEMSVEQLRQCVEMIWKKIDQHKKDNALAEAVKDAPIGVGADAPPLWVEKPSKPADQDKLAHTGYVEQEKKRQGRR